MVREFCSKEEVFRGGLRAVPDGGWGRRGNLFYSFSYILTARRRINKLMMKLVENSVLVLVHAIP